MGLCASVDRCGPHGWGLSLSTDNPKAAYAAVTAAYWAFMLTDGALRMLVLLHFHTLGFSPVQLAYLFVLYEIAGVVTNLSAGWLANRFGLTSTLYVGLMAQIIALLALACLDPAWGVTSSVIFIMCVQGLSGIAKDLSKMSAKSAVKVLAPDGSTGLFKWVAFLTGSKNAVKGLGFLLGTLLLGLWGFTASVLGMAMALIAVFVAVVIFMPSGLPTGQKGAKFTDVFSKNRNINWLSAARVFLFGARDVWFVVGIPIYFYAVLSDGTAAGNRTAFFTIGTFMALWIIGYGFIQAIAPKILGRGDDAKTIRQATLWAWILALIPAVLTLCILTVQNAAILTPIIVVGLLVFGAVFALNSALHSFLILVFTDDSRVTMDVGFYYMANASGRLIGTVLSGLSYQLGGVAACLAVSAIMIGLSAICAGRLR